MQAVSLDERVESSRGNKEKINRLVEEYKPFIASCTEKVTGRYVRYGEDDELSIALIAFVEAIEAYDKGKGSFLPFAGNVIRRRIIDYFRKEKRHKSTLPLSSYCSDNSEEIDLSSEQSIKRFDTNEINEYRRLELEDLKKELDNWGISFFELAKVSPKHKKTRSLCANIMSFILSHPNLLSLIKDKRYLPIHEIEKRTGIPRKKIERFRKYIIAITIIVLGDYQYIQDYIEIDTAKTEEVNS